MKLRLGYGYLKLTVRLHALIKKKTIVYIKDIHI